MEELEESRNERLRPDYREDYKRLISLLLGSLHLSYQSQSRSRSKSVEETSRRLTKGAKLSVPADLPDCVQFGGFQSLGDIKRILSKQNKLYPFEPS